MERLAIPENLDRGEPARLIPVTADSNREARAASILLATMTAVPSFAREVFATIGQRVGARSGLRCFTEVRFKNEQGINLRPDGLIVLDGGRGRTWSCIVECKIGAAELSTDQVEAYLQLAKQNDVQAVLTVSNQFCALPTHSPVRVSKSLLRNVELFHWSWVYLKTAAHLLLNDEFDSPEQRYILSEFYRYFDHDSVGISHFDRMNSDWKDIVGQVIANATLNKISSIVENTVAAWHQEVRDLCLLMSAKVRRPVRLRLSRAHASDPAERMKADCEYLAMKNELTCALEIPDAAAPIDVAANLRGRSISVSMNLSAPKDKQRASSRLNWLLRQLAKTEPQDIYIRCNWPGRAPPTQASLTDTRRNPDAPLHGNESMAPVSFDVLLVKDIASKFSGSRTFIEHLETIVPHFYSEVGERLRPYVPPPPRLQDAKQSEEDDSELNMSEQAGLPIAVPYSGNDESTQQQPEAASPFDVDGGLPIAAAYVSEGKQTEGSIEEKRPSDEPE
jgi:hypothetical protein